VRLTIRARLTLWFTAVAGGLLLAFCAGVLLVQGRLSRSQFDAELDTVAQTVDRVMREQLEENRSLVDAAAETRRSVDVPGRATAVLDGNGRTLAAHWRTLSRSVVPASPPVPWVASVPDKGRLWRIHVVRMGAAEGDYQILTAAPLSELDRERQLLARTLAVSAPAALLVAAAFCWWTASRALLPLTAMAVQAEAITAQSPDRRLTAASGGDEIGQLARAFNRLLDRLAAALRTERQFIADASHELRTPVSVARTAAEVTLAASRSEADYRDALTVVRDQTERIGRMVDDMLALARADAEGYRLRSGPVYLDEITTECIAAFATIAAQRQISLDCATPPDILAMADAELLRQLITNLVDNALKYTPAGGRVTVTLDVHGYDAVVAVADTGCGISGGDRERVFERFVRLNDARESAPGAGLGLPIARRIAELHGGSLRLDDECDGGCRFVACLPVVVSSGVTSRRASAAAPNELRPTHTACAPDRGTASAHQA